MPQAGLFSRGSILWEVNRESILLLTGQRALLLQLAHPLVAAGVAHHSRFEQEPLTRLRRTLDTVLTIVYADRDTALAAAQAVNERHAQVRGRLDEGTAAHPVGTPYTALDPDLLRWVHATLVDSARVGYACFVRPLTADESDRFVADSNVVARLFGVPDSHLFADCAEFDAFLRDAIAGPDLEITPTARRLADAVLHPPIPLVPRVLGDLASLASLALLPPEIRARYGFPWERRHRLAWLAARATLRGALPLLPAFLRAVPHARRAERRQELRGPPAPRPD